MPELSPPPEPAAQAESSRNSLPLLVVSRDLPPTSAPSAGHLRQWLGRLRFLPLIWLIFATGAFVGLYVQPPGLRFLMARLGLEPGGGTSHPIAIPVQKTPTAPAPTLARDVAALGRLVPEDDVVTIAPPYGAGDARIARIAVREGEKVEAGATLAVLDNEGPLGAAFESARATVAVREAALVQTRSTVTASRDEARAALARAQSAADTAQREFDRAEELRRRGVVTDTIHDQRRAARDQSAREVESVRASLSRFERDRVDDQPDVIVAARNLDAARAEGVRAERDLEKAFVRAPIAGTVLFGPRSPGGETRREGHHEPR